MSLAHDSSAQCGIFAEHAQRLLVHGLAVIPCDGKQPRIKGYGEWRHPPSVAAVKLFARKFPDHNIGFLAGPSRLFVADVDDVGQIDEVAKLLGDTPLQVATRRGVHLYYSGEVDCDDIEPGCLKKHGLNVDLKFGYGGKGLVMAPPSRHPENGSIYRHRVGDWNDLGRLSRPKLEWLHQDKNHDRARVGMRDGSRKQWLNDRLVSHVPFCDTLEELLDKAHGLNEELPKQGMQTLVDDVVIERAKVVWKRHQERPFEARFGRKSVADVTAEDVKRLSAMKHCSDAFMLLMLFRTEHGARTKRKETFRIVAEAMQQAQTLRGWNWKRITKARDALLDSGDIECVRKRRRAGGRLQAAEYKLVQCRREQGGRLVTLPPNSGGRA